MSDKEPSKAPTEESRRERKFRQRRDAIVEAARRVFERKGYSAASIEEIAGEADFAKGSIYYYFENKTSLFEAVFGEEVERIGDHFRQLSESDGNSLDRLRILVRDILSFYERNFALFRILIAPPDTPVASDNNAIADLRTKYLDIFRHDRTCAATILGEAQAEGFIAQDIQAEELADLLRGLISAEVRRWDERGRSEALVGKSDIILRLLLHGLSTPAASASL